MALRLSLTEFGGPLASPIVNNSSTPRIDAAWYVDFDQLAADSLDVDVSAVVQSDTFTIAPAALTLWASPSPTSIAQATALGTLSLMATAGLFVGQETTVTVANPGGRKYLVVTSAQGSG